MTISTLGIDIAKNTFQLHGADSTGKSRLQAWSRIFIEPPRNARADMIATARKSMGVPRGKKSSYTRRT
jgi:hypothetical protein